MRNKVKKCQCSRSCKAVVKSKNKKYARGHSPDSHTKERNKRAGKSIKAKYKRGEVKPRSGLASIPVNFSKVCDEFSYLRKLRCTQGNGPVPTLV